MTDLAALKASLAALAAPGGGWPYAPGQSAHLEPTCLALLALGGDAPGLAFLQSCAVGDGTYRLGHGRPEAAWPTSLVLFTRAALGEPAESLQPSARALLALKGRTLDPGGDDDINDIDGQLVGWPWAEGNFSWVEPTAWAMLALRKVGQGAHPRVEEGRRLLLDRVLEPGGVNYGNRRIFGITLEPIPTPTALALLALQGCADERVTKTLAWLRQAAAIEEDADHLAWAILALRAHGEERGNVARLMGRLQEALARREAVPYVRPSPVQLALACLALSPGNPFHLGELASPPLEPGKLKRPGWSLGGWAASWGQGILVYAAGALRQMDGTSGVHIAPASDYDAGLADILARQYESFRARVPLKGKRVVLKPNLVEYHREKVINTDPRFVAGVIELCQREGASEVLVAEGPGHWRNVEYLVGASGLGDVLRHYKVPFIDLNHDEPVKRPNLGRLTKLPHLWLTRTIDTADVVVSLPRLKTHHWAVATLSLKNLFGTLPGICYGWPKNELHWRGIDNSIVDIALTRTPDLAIVDGIVGMEGDGPLNGTPKPMGVIVMGTDLVAVDATCCRLMMLDPSKVGYLSLGQRKRLGNLDEKRIEQWGETVEARRKPFDTVPHFKPLWTGRG
ncbi:MAG: DUF362 domain-containing protein [Gemmataceae bacterium]|nr:DUF362 domain-containing protein [Gemmataceae bacterium]